MEEEKNRETKYQKSYFDVLGLCCSSEVPLIEKILHSLEGVKTVSVIVPSRTVIVVHDTLLISQLQIVKALNQARLEANIRAYGKGGKGEGSRRRQWPNPFVMASGVLLLLSFLKYVYHPMKWLALASVVAGLPPILLRSFAAIRRLTLDINILMLIAVAGAVAMRDYVEAASIVFLFTIAEWLESRASYKATAVMSALMSMAPQKAVLAETGEEVEVSGVAVGTVLAVKAGEVIPIDGDVVEGRSEVDESSLTGESFPVPKHPQSQVWAGTLNTNGYISVKTTALAENSAVAKMTKLVEEAQNSKSRTQRIIDTCAKYYTPAVVLAAAALAVVPLVARAQNPKHWFRLALVMLVSACPCALVLSTPVATFCALTHAASTGLLVKGGDFLEAMARVKVVAFDKTGTLTRGEFSVVDFRSLQSSATGLDALLLYWVSSIESKSSHPMAQALVDFARSNSVEPKPDEVTEFHVFPGEGIHGVIDGKSIHIGNHRIATRAGCHTVPDTEGMKGVTIGYVLVGAVPVGVFSLSDTCRSGAAEAVRELKQLGIKTIMLTGDSTAAATFVQQKLGNALDMVYAELLPEDKVRIVGDLKAKVGPTAMIGDGMNDAPALAAADVGISMGISGSAVAMETSHITLMSNDVRKVPAAVRLSRRTQWKIMQNIALSIVTKAAILALAFAGHPLLWAAILSDVGTCLLVIFNSMFLLRGSHVGGHHDHDHSHKHHHGGGVAKGSSDHQHQCCNKSNTLSQKCCGDEVNTLSQKCCGDEVNTLSQKCCGDEVNTLSQNCSIDAAVACGAHSHHCESAAAESCHGAHSAQDCDHSSHDHDHHSELGYCAGHDHEHVHDHDHDHEHGCSELHTPRSPGDGSHVIISIVGEAEPHDHDHKEEEHHHHHHHNHHHHHEEPAAAVETHDSCAHKKDLGDHHHHGHDVCSKATCYTPRPHHECCDVRKRCCSSYRRECARREACCGGVGIAAGGCGGMLPEITIEA